MFADGISLLLQPPPKDIHSNAGGSYDLRGFCMGDQQTVIPKANDSGQWRVHGNISVRCYSWHCKREDTWINGRTCINKMDPSNSIGQAVCIHWSWIYLVLPASLHEPHVDLLHAGQLHRSICWLLSSQHVDCPLLWACLELCGFKA